MFHFMLKENFCAVRKVAVDTSELVVAIYPTTLKDSNLHVKEVILVTGL
jgi:hypothetical protein